MTSNPKLDIYCHSCGYNLHGLSGNPLHCPECGADNTVDDDGFAISDEQLARYLRRLESAPALCLVMTVLTLVALTVSITMQTIGCLLPVLIPTLFVWPALAREFQDSCRNHPRWFRVLVRYQLCGIACLVVPFALLMLVAPYAAELSKSANIDSAAGKWVIHTAAAILLVLLIAPGVKWLYGYATREMRAMQSEAAHELARRAQRIRQHQHQKAARKRE